MQHILKWYNSPTTPHPDNKKEVQKVNPNVKCSKRYDYSETPSEITIYVCFDQNGAQLSSIDTHEVWDYGLDYYVNWATGKDCNEYAVPTAVTPYKGKSLCSLRNELNLSDI